MTFLPLTLNDDKWIKVIIHDQKKKERKKRKEYCINFKESNVVNRIECHNKLELVIRGNTKFLGCESIAQMYHHFKWFENSRIAHTQIIIF